MVRRVRVDFMLLGTVLLLSGWLLYKMWPSGSAEAELAESQADSGEPLREIISAPLENSSAILPFENPSPDPDNAYFAAGLHEELRHQMARVQNLGVISRKSVPQYADRDIAIPEIADELHVESVMDGGARFSEDEVRITAQLIDGETDEHLWAEVHQRGLTDMFSIQADLAEHIAGEFHTNFVPEDRKHIASQSSQSPQALAN